MTKPFLSSLLLFLTFLCLTSSALGQADSAGGIFTVTTSLPTARMNAVEVSLPDGRFVAIGGHGAGFVSLNSMLVYQNGTYTETTLPYPADACAVSRLQDGQLLIFGGSSDLGVPAYSDAFIFNPTNNQITSVGNTNLFRASSGTATLLDGRVLVAGAWWVHNNAHTQAEIFSPTSNTFSLSGTLNFEHSSPIVIPTSDSNAVVIGGSTPTGGIASQAIEKFNRTSNTFSILRNHLIPADTTITVGVMSGVITDELRLNDGRYILFASREVNNVIFPELVAFNPTTLVAERLAITPALPSSADNVAIITGVYDRTRNNLYLLASNRTDNRNIRIYTINLATLQRTNPTGWYNYGDYPYYAIFRVLPNGTLFLGGGTTDGSNFSPSNRAVLITPTLLSHQEPQVPKSFLLHQNYPNPFNPSTTIAYGLPVASDVRLDVFDVLGRKIATLVNSKQPSGDYSVLFNASTLCSGVYFYRLQAGSFVQTKKMLLIK